METRKLHTFFKADGTELRVRAIVVVPEAFTRDDYACVCASPAAVKKLRAAGPLTWGFGRFAPVRNISTVFGRI